MEKKLLRKWVLAERKKISNKVLLDELIKNKLLEHSCIQKSQNILVYISKEGEVSTLKLIEELLKLKKNIYAPRIENKNISFYKFNSLSELKLGKFNILEPSSDILFQEEENSCMIVPGLLFDKNNNRLGYGGGYYDRYLENKNIYKIGICYSNFLVNKLDVCDYDIKMDEVITER